MVYALFNLKEFVEKTSQVYGWAGAYLEAHVFVLVSIPLLEVLTEMLVSRHEELTYVAVHQLTIIIFVKALDKKASISLTYRDT